MKISSKEEFEKLNVFGTGTANTAYAKYFIGDSMKSQPERQLYNSFSYRLNQGRPTFTRPAQSTVSPVPSNKPESFLSF